MTKNKKLSMENETKKKEIEIDFLELASKLWDSRRFILKVMAIFAVIGLFVAIFSAKEYTSSVTMVPQPGDSQNKVGGLAGLAAMAGINLGDIDANNALSPTIYPIIMQSVLFKKELMQTLVKFDNIPQPITLYDYYTNSKYHSFSPISIIKRYTIGLPGLIIKAMKGEDKKKNESMEPSSLLQISQKENDVSKLLAEKVLLTINQKEGTITLSANMPEAMVSTQVVEAARLLLQKYITTFKIDKVQQSLNFIAERYTEAKHNFEAKQKQLAVFRDANQNVISAIGKTHEEQLKNEYNLCFSLYSELAQQFEQAKIKVKETQPILTVIEPAVVPLQKSKPNRPLILIMYMFLGIVSSVLWILIKYKAINLKSKSI